MMPKEDFIFLICSTASTDIQGASLQCTAQMRMHVVWTPSTINLEALPWQSPTLADGSQIANSFFN